MKPFKIKSIKSLFNNVFITESLTEETLSVLLQILLKDKVSNITQLNTMRELYSLYLLFNINDIYQAISMQLIANHCLISIPNSLTHAEKLGIVNEYLMDLLYHIPEQYIHLWVKLKIKSPIYTD